MSEQLVLHRGGWEASKADLASVPVPEETDSYVPVPYARFIEELELHIPRFGFSISAERFGLNRSGSQMFGVFTCTNGNNHQGYALAIGLRNSYDRSLSVGLVAGSQVFCCDNLAFSGEASMHRKHTANVFRDLPDLIYRMLSQVSTIQSRIHKEIAAMKAMEVSAQFADHLMVEAVRGNIVPASRLPKVIHAWEKPQFSEFDPRTAWSLYNAFTEVQKSRSPRVQVEGSLRLTELFRSSLNL